MQHCCHAHFLDVDVRSFSRSINMSVLFSGFSGSSGICAHILINTLRPEVSHVQYSINIALPSS